VVPRLHLLAIEINAVWHCNLSCVACTHASPVAHSGLADPRVVARDLANLSMAVDVDEVRILGGEPLLHPDLAAVLRAVRGSGLAATVRVSTNGTRLSAAGFEWLALVDEVHVSRYPGTNVRDEALDELARRCRDAGKTLILEDFHSFRHAQPSGPLHPDEARAVFDTCQQAHAWSCHTVHDGYVHLCPVTADPGFADPEACPIEPTSTLADRLGAFLDRPEPLRACTLCLGTVGKRFAHRQANAKTWLTLTRSGSVDPEQLEAVRRDPLADNGCSTHEVLVDGARQSHWVGWRA
jgi:organic radical activating enzyme